MYGRLLEILSAHWLISPGEVVNYIPLLFSILNGNKISLEDFQDDIARNKPFSVSGITGLAGPNDLSNPNLPENSVAVIPIQGVMTAWKSQDLMQNITMAENNPSISSILFLVNSPGGMVFMTDLAAAAIKNTTLPTVAFVMNMAASAAMWLTSAADKILVSSPMDSLGSIGTMTSYMDVNGFLKEKLGITIYDIYATKSTAKNEEVRALLAGDQGPIVNRLDFANELFHQAIQDNRGISPDSEVFSGAIYHAQQAIEMGLADAITTIDDAVSTAYQMGLRFRINQLYANQ
jgi:ClpP class serine protease